MSDHAHGYVDIDDLLSSKPLRVMRALLRFDLADWDDLSLAVGIPDSERERNVFYAVMRRLVASGRVNRTTIRGQNWYALTDKGRAEISNASARIAASVQQVAS